MVQFTDFVKDIATRTRHNLEKIEAQSAAGFDVYEVTQLINSLLGMLVFVHAKENLPDTPWSEIDGFPSVDFLLGEDQTEKFDKFIKFVRHAVAHGNVEAEAEGKGSKTITHLVLWNIPPGTDKENWRIRSSIEGIRWIAVYLTELITGSTQSR